jgi:hypothetical protein
MRQKILNLVITMKKYLLIVPILMCFSLTIYGQQKMIDSTKIIQLSGVVVSEIDLNAIPYVTVYNKTKRHGVISDYFGFFSLVSFPGDTLYFSNQGYNTSSYIVPDTLKENRYSIIHMLQRDAQQIQEVTVYPWPSREEFARYFVEMKPYEDAMRRAQRELSGESLAFVAARLDADASLAAGNAYNQRNTRLYTNGQLPVNNLFNPYSWGKLISDWKEGKLSRQ